MRIVGIVLICIGLLTLALPYITFTKQEKVLDIGPIEAVAEKKETYSRFAYHWCSCSPCRGGHRHRICPQGVAVAMRLALAHSYAQARSRLRSNDRDPIPMSLLLLIILIIPPGWCIAIVALQQRLGLLSKWRTGPDPGDSLDSCSARKNLAAVGH